MPGTTQAVDRTSGYRSYGRDVWAFRPVANGVYTPGTLLQLVAQDQQLFADEATVQPSPAAAAQQKLCGVVADFWPGFAGSVVPASYTAPGNIAAIRGTTLIDAIVKGFHPGVLIDATTGAALADGSPIIASTTSVGYGQASALGAGGPTATAVVGVLALPAAGIGSAVAQAALVQASATDTITGAPAAGDVLSVTLQIPYVESFPGVAQTATFSTLPLTGPQAANVTAAAAQLAVALNANPAFSAFYVATSALGVVTIAVNTLAALFNVNYAGGIGGGGQVALAANFFQLSLSGQIGNSISFAVGYTRAGASTGVATASGANLAGGAGFKGLMPAFISSEM